MLPTSVRAPTTIQLPAARGAEPCTRSTRTSTALSCCSSAASRAPRWLMGLKSRDGVVMRLISVAWCMG